MPANREYHYRQMEQTDVSKTYADNLDAICILFMFFLLRNPFGWKKQTATRQVVIYLLEAFLQLERPMCYCLLSLLLFVMNL